MSKFKIGDRISAVRKSSRYGKIVETLATGKVIKGPFIVDDIDHYNIQWEDNSDIFCIICDIPSTKYEYIKAPFKFLK